MSKELGASPQNSQQGEWGIEEPTPVVPLGYHRNMIVLKSKGSLQAKTALCSFPLYSFSSKRNCYLREFIFLYITLSTNSYFFFIKYFNVKHCHSLFALLLINNSLYINNVSALLQYTRRYVAIYHMQRL